MYLKQNQHLWANCPQHAVRKFNLATHAALDKLSNKAPLSLRQVIEIRLILCPVGNCETHSLSLQNVGLFLSEFPIL